MSFETSTFYLTISSPSFNGRKEGNLPSRESQKGFDRMKLEKNLYAYLWQNAYENNCNTYLIRGEVTVLIDPGHSRHIPNLLRQMEADGVSREEVDLVILTHSHP